MRAAFLSLVLVAGCAPPSAPEPRADVAAELAALDERTPLPLLPPMAVHQRAQMREHLVALQEITAALAADDLPRAASASSRLGTSDSMTAMCTHMGAGAPGFTERALEMHRLAGGIGVAARRGDREAALAAMADTMAACTGCHATYRQEVVDHARWSALTHGAAAHR